MSRLKRKQGKSNKEDLVSGNRFPKSDNGIFFAQQLGRKCEAVATQNNPRHVSQECKMANGKACARERMYIYKERLQKTDEKELKKSLFLHTNFFFVQNL
mgnify:CR=1 FL=1